MGRLTEQSPNEFWNGISTSWGRNCKRQTTTWSSCLWWWGIASSRHLLQSEGGSTSTFFMLHMKNWQLLLVFHIAVCACCTAYYSPTGSGSSCNQTHPCLFSKLVNLDSAICLLDGTYHINKTLSTTNCWSIEAVNPGKVILTGFSFSVVHLQDHQALF